MTWWTDPRMLAAGNARGIPGGDPDAMPVSPTAGRIAGSSGLPLPDRRELTGDLDARAAVLGVPVEQLVAIRRHRAPGALARLRSALGRRSR